MMEIAIAVVAVIVGLAGCFGGRRAEPFVFACGGLFFATAVGFYIGRHWLSTAQQVVGFCAILSLGILFLCIRSALWGATVTGYGMLFFIGALFCHTLQTALQPILLGVASALISGILAAFMVRVTVTVASAVLLVLGIFELTTPFTHQSFLFEIPSVGTVGGCFILTFIGIMSLAGVALRPIFAKLKPHD